MDKRADKEKKNIIIRKLEVMQDRKIECLTIDFKPEAFFLIQQVR